MCQTDRTSGRGSRWRHHRARALRITPFCGWCGTLKRLQVHHIVPFRLTNDNRQVNLIPLCERCHKRVETVVHHAEAAGSDPATIGMVFSNILRERQALTLLTLREIKNRITANDNNACRPA